jgi:thiamine kinase-like enzyme
MRWSLDTYLSCARLLGSAHAALSRPGSFTNHSWLCRDYLSDYSLEKPFDRTIIYRDHAWASLKALNEDAAASRTELTQFAASEPTLLRRARASPITLCHNDFWTRNLFASADGLVTLIDWAFVGKGAIGADIANLVASAGFDRHVEPGSLRDFGEDVFSSYACGLRQGGWTGTLAESRASYLASFGKYAWVVAAMLQSACEPSHPIYVGYGDGASMDFTAVAHTLRVLAEWTSGALT